MSVTTPYNNGLEKNDANYVPLSPLSFLPRAASVYPQHPSLIHGERRYTWSETLKRCQQLASALYQRGIRHGDTVAIMGYNTPETYEAHFGIPMIGAVLNTLNTRLDAKAIAYMLNHGEAKILLTDQEAAPVIREALKLIDHPITVIDIEDSLADSGECLGEKNYEALLTEGDADFQWSLPTDEWQAITLNYTSGTTGKPKGVVYHHRGAYLNAINNALGFGMSQHPLYLWTLPMFHCNGWCFPWTLAAMNGTSVCLRKVDVEKIYDLIVQEGITHYCGAPIVHNMLANAPADIRAKKQHTVKGMVAACAPPASVLEAMEKNGFEITHVYGLTETYGPAVMCEWHHDWDNRTSDERARLKSRQGVRYLMQEGLMVANPETMIPVPSDGKTIGEIFMRGNITMMGYLKNTDATQKAFHGGWFHTGDLAVMHADGYVEIKDRSKDIIISGGENISTIEIEDVLYRHPAVLEAAVVAKADEKWGETPCAFVKLKPDAEPVTAGSLIEFCREHMAHYKVPRHVVFSELPKTSTGKIQKFMLREQARHI